MIKKIAEHPFDSYAFLWVILCFVIALVILMSMVLISKVSGGI